MGNESNKQTAVNYLIKEFSDILGPIETKPMQDLLIMAAIKQAKEMEKEQIENAYEIGFADAWDDARYDDEPTYGGAEQYYNETYGGNK
jgi:hypothetical protein